MLFLIKLGMLWKTQNPNKGRNPCPIAGNGAFAAWSGLAGGAENLGYRGLQHYALSSALGQQRWLGWSCSCSGCSRRSGSSGCSGCSGCTCTHLTELGEQLAAHMAKFGVLAIMCATILAAISLST